MTQVLPLTDQNTQDVGGLASSQNSAQLNSGDSSSHQELEEEGEVKDEEMNDYQKALVALLAHT